MGMKTQNTVSRRTCKLLLRENSCANLGGVFFQYECDWAVVFPYIHFLPLFAIHHAMAARSELELLYEGPLFDRDMSEDNTMISIIMISEDESRVYFREDVRWKLPSHLR